MGQRLRTLLLSPFALPAMLCGTAAATDTSKAPAGANFQAAHERKDTAEIPVEGAGVRVGIVDLIQYRTNEDTGAPFTEGIIDTMNKIDPNDPTKMIYWHNLGTRLKEQWSFAGVAPQSDPPAANEIKQPMRPGTDRHPTLGADVSSGAAFTIDQPNKRTYLGVAPKSDVYFGGLPVMFTDAEFQSVFDWLHRKKSVRLFNLSFGRGVVTDDTADYVLARFADWFMQTRDDLMVVAAGNEGPNSPPGAEQNPVPGGLSKITRIADAYNGIAVGSSDATFAARDLYSSYRLASDTGFLPDVRGKPDILAPGHLIWDGKTYVPVGASGTSFAAPHVTGAAALLKQVMAPRGVSDEHLVLKAAILNAARKRQITGANASNGISQDNPATSAEASDFDYLDAAGTGFRPAPTMTTADWTPSKWAVMAGVFVAQLPLDDEQGTGVLDVDRAVLQVRDAEQGPGNVNAVGWDRGEFAVEDFEPVTGEFDYTLPKLAEDGFLTATLAWDRIIEEIDVGMGGSAQGQVDDGDTYAILALVNLDMIVRVEDAQAPGGFKDYARSVSSVDNVEHLHLPVSADTTYQIRVKFAANGGFSTGLLAYGLAWHAAKYPEVPALSLYAIALLSLALVLAAARLLAAPRRA